MVHNNLTLLLIDDDIETQRIFRLMATFNGGTLAAVKNAESALNYLEYHEPDVIIIDLYLDDTNGYEVLRLIRESDLNPKCPVVATTAYYTPITRGNSILSGFDGYLEKPLRVESLWSYLERLTGYRS